MMKIVWLCHFSNPDVRAHLNIKSRRPFYNLMRRLAGLPSKQGVSGDYGSWITAGIEELSKRDDIELHVVFPQPGLKKKIEVFNIANVHYYCFNVDWTIFTMNAIKNVALWQKIQTSSKYIKRFIEEIQPDIINLHGSENAFHSCAILDLNVTVPTIVTLQTIYNNPDRLKFYPNANKTKAWVIDEMVHKHCKYFCVCDKMYKELLLRDNPEAVTLLSSDFVSLMPQIEIPENRIYDFVNFANVHSDKKGTTDSIRALAIVRKTHPNVTLNIVGKIDEEAKQPIDNLIETLNLRGNVVFTDFFSDQKDLFKHIVHSKYALLPTKIDVIAGTIIQSMYYGLPVITYKTSGTPLLNEDSARVFIAENGDIDQLSNYMNLCLTNPKDLETMVETAKVYAQERMDNSTKVSLLMKVYKATIMNYKDGIDIPSDLLYV